MLAASALPERSPSSRPSNSAVSRRSADRVFRQLVLPRVSQLRALALRWCRNASEADDLLQDALERAYLAAGVLDEHSNPLPWLTTIMRNLFRDRCRRDARRWTLGDAWLGTLATPAPEEVALWRAVDAEHLENALRQVDDSLRRAFILRWQEQRSYREISELLDIPINTVGTRLFRARRALRALVETELREAAAYPPMLADAAE